MDILKVKQIYQEVFLYIQHSNIDLFLCGGASSKTNASNRDLLRKRLEKNDKLSIFYPEDMFMELLSRKKYDLFTLENFLAENSDLIMIVCESPGSFTELGAFTSNDKTLDKLVVLIQKRYKNDKSFIMQGPVRYIESKNKNNVIYFNNDMDDMEKAVECYLSSKYWFYGNKKYARKYGRYTKEIDLISGQFYFIMLLLYFYNRVEIKDMNEAIKTIYHERKFEPSRFEVIYTAALKRLYKEGMLVKEVEDGAYFYRLTQKGYYNVKKLLKDIMVDDRDKVINGIRLNIITDQYC
ncbi:MAG: retron St85 family effector protein [Agathobacter sp.]|nr:retron St85 family effector protein [Agathobacter sp.]